MRLQHDLERARHFSKCVRHKALWSRQRSRPAEGAVKAAETRLYTSNTNKLIEKEILLDDTIQTII
jgi:hypothetical protein